MVAGVLSGDMTHKASSDCPLHGCSDRLGSNASCGGRAGGSSNGNGCNGACREQAPRGGSDTTAQHNGRLTRRRSSDSLAPSCSPTANGHSTRTSKTDHAPETSSPCKPSARRNGRTGDTSGKPALTERDHGNGGCNTSAAELADSPGNRTSRRIARKPLARALYGARLELLREKGCTCSFYQEKTEETSHFATFPPALGRALHQGRHVRTRLLPAVRQAVGAGDKRTERPPIFESR